MDRRTFIKSTTAAAAMTAGAAASNASPAARPALPVDPRALTSASHRWRVAAPADWALRDAAVRLAVRIAAMSGGEIAFEWIDPPSTGSDTGSGPKEVSAFAAAGIDAAFGIAPDLLGAPHLALFTGLPSGYGLPPQDLLAWLTIAGGSDLLDEAAANLGTKVLIAGHSGAGPGLWADEDAADLRAFCESAITATALGATVAKRIQAPFAAGSTATTRAAAGRARVTERPADPVAALTEARAAGQTIWFRDGLHTHGSAWSLVLSLTAWNSLDDSQRGLVEAAAIAEAYATVAAAAYQRRAVLPVLARAGAIAARPLPGQVRDAIATASAAVVAEMIAGHPDLAAACPAYDAFRQVLRGEAGHLPRATPVVA